MRASIGGSPRVLCRGPLLSRSVRLMYFRVGVIFERAAFFEIQGLAGIGRCI